MFKNYFTTAWRNVLKNKGYSILNILGLATGMAVALLIGLWVHFEYSYDKFLPNYERLYQVRRNFNSNGEILNFTTTSLRLAEALRQVPEIEYVAESDWMGEHGLMVGDKKLYIKGAQIGDNFLKMFEYPLLEGNVNTAFKSPYSIVVAESLAKSLFGRENPMGKTVRYDNEHDLVVTGVLKDVPANSTLQFQFIVPFSFLDATKDFIRERRVGSFSGNANQIFVKLKEGVSYAQVSAKIKDIQKIEKGNINAMNSDVILQPIKNWHLYSNYLNGKEQGGFLEYVQMFTVIGILVLLIA
jgi:putative ABC transport system permease protein